MKDVKDENEESVSDAAFRLMLRFPASGVLHVRIRDEPEEMRVLLEALVDELAATYRSTSDGWRRYALTAKGIDALGRALTWLAQQTLAEMRGAKSGER